MIKPNALKRKLKDAARPCGIFIRIPSPAVVEIAGAAGLDFVILDNEHGAFSDETLENMVRAADWSGLTALVRIPENRPWLVTRTLDMGADGLWVPQINTREEAQSVVHAARYAPAGQRGMNTACRRAGWGAMKRSDYLSRANDEIVIVVQIEDIQALDNLEGIFSVPGLDMISVGLGDLAQSMGFPGKMDHPDVLQVDKQIREVARQRGLYIAGEDTAKAGSDVAALLDGFRRLLAPATLAGQTS